jgi:hemerythrin-like domain-containing protein
LKKRASAKRSAPTKAARRKNAARAAASQSTRSEPAAESTSRFASAATSVRGAVAGVAATVSARIPWQTADDDAIALLETDHRRLEDLLKRGEETTERAVKGRTELLKTLTTELNVHELIEEKVLYPALKAHPQAKEIVLEGYEEHHVADLIVKELEGLAKNDEQWGAKFKVLKENIEHHIEEEEGEMFRTARGVLSREDLRQLGARMAAMKADAGRGRR